MLSPLTKPNTFQISDLVERFDSFVIACDCVSGCPMHTLIRDGEQWQFKARAQNLGNLTLFSLWDTIQCIPLRIASEGIS
jgi:hypothetical protein